MKSLFTLLLISCSLFSIAQTKFVLDENAEIRTISGSFNSIEVSSAIHVYLTKGETESIAISANEAQFKQNIKTEIENNVLKIYLTDNSYKINKSKRISVYVSYKSLQHISVSDASNVLIADELIAPTLSIKLSDASVLKGEIKAEELAIKLRDASVANLSGIANNININCRDASSFNSYNLKTKNAIVKATDASNVNLYVSNEISAKASDASNITFKGDAIIKEKQTSDASNISHVN